MDVARCTIDNHSYDIPTFESLSDQQIGRFRRHLVCPECGGPGFYRRESRSGQAACFGARPHEQNCPLAAAEPRRGGALGGGQDELINRGERIEVDFDYGAHPPVNPDPDVPHNPRGQGGRFIGEGLRRNAVMHRRLSTLLRNLIHSPDFRVSEQLIALPEGEFRVRDFFVEFSEINNSHENEYRGYWGFISDAAMSRDNPPDLWLNSGGRDDVSIVCNSGTIGELQNRFPFEELDDLAGSYALIFGRLRFSQYGKKYLAINEIEKISISL